MANTYGLDLPARAARQLEAAVRASARASFHGRERRRPYEAAKALRTASRALGRGNYDLSWLPEDALVYAGFADPPAPDHRWTDDKIRALRARFNQGASLAEK